MEQCTTDRVYIPTNACSGQTDWESIQCAGPASKYQEEMKRALQISLDPGGKLQTERERLSSTLKIYKKHIKQSRSEPVKTQSILNTMLRSATAIES